VQVDMTSDEDAADVARVLDGDVAAFEGIVRRWQTPLLNVAWRFCRQRELAEDLTQEALMLVHRGLPRWKGRSSFSTWMFAVALNHFRSRLRKHAPDLAGLEKAFDLPDARAGEGEESSRAEALRRAVAGLPPKYREAIVMHYFQDRDVRQASCVLGIREGTFKARLARARALLSRTLGAAPGAKTTCDEA
jgi:RNA polymerase sigma-70 factor, ECF subfamily